MGFKTNLSYEVKVSLIYLLAASLWIFLSDYALQHIALDFAGLAWYQMLKGWLFVIVTTAFLYTFVKRGIENIRFEQKQAEHHLRQKEKYVHELNHRVRNNLALILGFIELHLDELKDRSDQQPLISLREKVHSLSRIQKLLYEYQDPEAIPFKKFLTSLIEHVEHHIEGVVNFHADLEEIYLNINQAIPLGLLITEYMVPTGVNFSDCSCDLYLEVSREDDNNIYLSIRIDNLIGDYSEFKVKERENIRSLLIHSFAKQLNGNITVNKSEEDRIHFGLVFLESQNTGSSAHDFIR